MLLAILGAVVKTKDNIAKGPRAVRDVEVRDGGTVLDEGNGDGAVTDVEGSDGAAAGVDVALVGRIGEGRRYEQEGQEKKHFLKKKKLLVLGMKLLIPFFPLQFRRDVAWIVRRALKRSYNPPPSLNLLLDKLTRGQRLFSQESFLQVGKYHVDVVFSEVLFIVRAKHRLPLFLSQNITGEKTKLN